MQRCFFAVPHHSSSHSKKHNLSGFWSKCISQKNRLIYNFADNSIYIFAIDRHYDPL
ncbi:type II toxin-antitoxin system YoeB family toxin [Oceanobacter sp. 5_MG-2023]|uniref:type II toxin-antitoxin system YoeB family toxin n=1 Tax=Oceanobacter sp. 5_MG-2023 TaxID=3062645 RepID=UPI0026E22414|nr:type II toxin-antitoxin system YoeB family toxin [Oceanobacter sp. 5_MG-2023]MDO6681221.1 type II toxin-antitoxin system YoeB family toxin [Oceanobacter sp. 5_MG-2023]